MSTKNVPQASPTKKVPVNGAVGYKPLAPGSMIPFHAVQATRFELVDDQGHVRGGMGFTDQGEPAIFLVDDIGGGLRLRADMVLHEDGPSLALMDPRGKGELTMRVSDDGAIGINFSDQSGRSRMVFGLDDKVVPIAAIFDKRGKTIRFAKHGWKVPTTRAVEKRLAPLAAAGKKTEFINMVVDLLNIDDTQDAEELWRGFQQSLLRKKQKPANRAAQARVRDGARSV